MIEHTFMAMLRRVKLLRFQQCIKIDGDAVWGTRRATEATQNVLYFPQEVSCGTNESFAQNSTCDGHAAGRGSLLGPAALLGVKTWLSTLEIVSFELDTKSRWSILSGVYARGSIISHQSALEMCNLSSAAHSSLEKDNSLNHSCVSPTFGVYITNN